MVCVETPIPSRAQPVEDGRVIEIKSAFCAEVEVNEWQPDGQEQVNLMLQVEIGSRGREARDVFTLWVTTPEALMTLAGRGLLVERATLVLSPFSWKALWEAIDAILERCDKGDGWARISQRLERYFHYEFEDYVPPPPLDGPDPDREDEPDD